MIEKKSCDNLERKKWGGQKNYNKNIGMEKINLILIVRLLMIQT